MIKRDNPPLTSYDLIKVFALLIMIVDHVGFYFFPFDMWWRAVGRTGFPVWFFLVGYASTRKIPPSLWIGGFIVTALWMISGRQFLPLNALFSIILIRLMLDGVMARALRSHTAFWGIFLLLGFLSFPSNIPVEYGTIALLFAMFGFLRRHKRDIRLDAGSLFLFTVGIVFVFIINQLVFMPVMSAAQYGVILLGTLAVAAVLFVFEPREFPALTRALGWLTPAIRFLGRQTLEIYVIHMVLFTAAAMHLFPDIFRFMDFQWLPASMLRVFLP